MEGKNSTKSVLVAIVNFRYSNIQPKFHRSGRWEESLMVWKAKWIAWNMQRWVVQPVEKRRWVTSSIEVQTRHFKFWKGLNWTLKFSGGLLMFLCSLLQLQPVDVAALVLQLQAQPRYIGLPFRWSARCCAAAFVVFHMQKHPPSWSS